MMGPCWEIALDKDKEVEEEIEVDVAVTNRASEPIKNLTPEEQAQIAESKEMASQLEQEMYMIDMMFEVLEVLSILIDVITFVDLFEAENAFDSGTIAGKGLINAGFTLYNLFVDNFVGKKGEDEGLAL